MDLIDIGGLRNIGFGDSRTNYQKQEGEKDGKEHLTTGTTAGTLEKDPVLTEKSFDMLTGGIGLVLHLFK